MTKEFADELLHNNMVSGWWLQVLFRDHFYEPYIAQYKFHFDTVIRKHMDDPVMILKEELIDQITNGVGTLGALHVYAQWLQNLFKWIITAIFFAHVGLYSFNLVIQII